MEQVSKEASPVNSQKNVITNTTDIRPQCFIFVSFLHLQ